MPDYLKYQKSISDELISIKDRVRNFIDNHHWGEDGRYKEIILSHVLRHHLPKGVSVGTGFVVNNTEITKQIDIIVYRDDYPLLFRQDDFIIAPTECVLGIIEVKSRANIRVICEALDSASYNGRIINKNVFNGIFAFENEIRNIRANNLENALVQSSGTVNNICFGKDVFLKYWEFGVPINNPHHDNYAVYQIEDMAFGYFISNLIEDVYISIHGEQISDTLRNMFYPIEDTKEVYRVDTIDVEEVQTDDQV